MSAWMEIKLQGTARDIRLSMADFIGLQPENYPPALAADLVAATEADERRADLGAVIAKIEPAETPVAEAAAPKRTRGRPKKEEAGTENPTAGVAGSDTSSTAATNSAEDASPSEPLTKEKTKERLMDLVQKIGSPQALAYMNDKMGYAKFGDMPAEKYAEFVKLIDAKLAEG